MAARGVTGGTALMKAMRQVQKDAIEFLHGRRARARRTTRWCSTPCSIRVANVLCPACKLWNTGHGAQHDARSRQPDGRLRHHRGLPRLPRPQVDGRAARSHLRRSRSRAAPPAQRHHDRRALPGPVPRVDPRDAHHRQRPARDRRLRPGHRHAAVAVDASTTCRRPPTPTAPSSTRARARASPSRWPTRSAGCWPRAARFSTCWSWKRRAPRIPPWPKGSPGLTAFLTDLCHVQAARAAGEVGRVCAELVFGYNRHPAWDTEGCATCYQADDLECMEALIPGIASLARGYTDVIEHDGAHASKAGPCVRFDGLEQFATPARAHGRLPHRLAARQGSRRRCPHQGHDSRSAGLPRMSQPGDADRQTHGRRYRLRRLRPGHGRLPDHALAPAGEPRRHARHREPQQAGPAPAGDLLRARRRYRLRRLRRGDARPRHPRQLPRSGSQPDPHGGHREQEKVVYLLDPAGASRRSAAHALRRRRDSRAWAWPKTTPWSCPTSRPSCTRTAASCCRSASSCNTSAAELMASGAVQIWPGMPVQEALIEGGRVRGIRLTDQGVDKTAIPKPVPARHGRPRRADRGRRWAGGRGRPPAR